MNKKFEIPFSSGTQTEEEVSVAEEVSQGYSLILYNDDVNTFNFVIETLMEVCNHDLVQAEQCTILVHYKGKCDVMSGSYEELKPPCEEMLRRKLSAKIE